MSTMASQITSLTIVYSTIYSGAEQRLHQSSTSLAFVRGIQGTSEFPSAQMASNSENNFHLMMSSCCKELLWVKGHEAIATYTSDAIWRHRSGSELAELMACCLTAPGHYQSWCWLIIRKVQWHSSDFLFKSPRGQWVYVRHGDRESAGVIKSPRYTTTNCISHTCISYWIDAMLILVFNMNSSESKY